MPSGGLAGDPIVILAVLDATAVVHGRPRPMAAVTSRGSQCGWWLSKTERECAAESGVLTSEPVEPAESLDA